VRPSEETPPSRHLRAFPQGLSPTLAPWRGELRTPTTTELASPEHVPIKPPGFRSPPMLMLCPGSHPAGIHGRGDRAPPRKPPLASSPGFRRKAVLAWLVHPAVGRALHARNEGTGFAEGYPR